MKLLIRFLTLACFLATLGTLAHAQEPEPQCNVSTDIPIVYDLNNEGPYVLNEEYVVINGDTLEGFWTINHGFVSPRYNSIYYFSSEGITFDQLMPRSDLLNNAYDVVVIPRPHERSSWASALKHTSIGLAALAGFSGGMGEGFLSRDGNWDTRSARSHDYRDASLWLLGGSGLTLGAGFAINLSQPDYKIGWRDVLEFIGYGATNAVTYKLFSIAGYEFASK